MTARALDEIAERDRIRLARLEAERAMGWPEPFDWPAWRRATGDTVTKHRAARDWTRPVLPTDVTGIDRIAA